MDGNGNAHLAEAKLAARKEMKTLRKDGTNPHFGSKFTTLATAVEEVDPKLLDHGLLWSAWPTTNEHGQPALRYRLEHVESGEVEEDVMPLLLAKADMQGLGSAVSYARRYALFSVLNLVADDDDGTGASVPSPDLSRRKSSDGAPTEKQLNFLKKQVDKAKREGMKGPVLRALLDKVGSQDVEITEGWMNRLSKAQVSGLLDAFNEGVLPTGESDIPADFPDAPEVEPGDDIPFDVKEPAGA